MDPDGPLPPFVTSDENLSAGIDGSAYLEQKMQGAAQLPDPITARRPVLRAVQQRGQPDKAQEYFRIAKGERGELGADGLESDLFAGIEP